MSDLPPAMPQPPREPLNYATPTQDRPAGGVPIVGQMAIGCAAYVVAMILAAFLAANADPEWYFITPSIMLVLLIALAVVARVHWRWKGALLGVLIGLVGTIGLGLLAIGLCFAALGH